MSEEIKVVYVEDEPSIAKLLSSGLGLFGIQVNPIFMSAEDLLAHTGDAEFGDAQILMFDIRLPKMTGVDLATQLRARGEKRPFVLVSAWPPPSRDKLAEIQAVFLPKPFDFPDVVHTIQKLVWGNHS
ncbi:MAG: response regulator [Chloroflexi bacterium]|nr:response regulator [Chloroflexota bacterium]MCI0580750.1 response regulator [Chloroflexota bacterium]MCI0644613.1 response regulator [Chloroflexota bacterium]MCI0727618.1 response regulator [Chloroflexota bacterium]